MSNCFESTVRICSFVMSLLFGFTMVGLAIAGIILISINDLYSKDDSNDDRDYLHNHWFQLMIAASVATLPFSIFGTLGLILLVKKRRDELTSTNKVHKSTSTDGVDQTTSTNGVHQTPSTDGVDQTTSTNGVHQTPSTDGVDQTPSTDAESQLLPVVDEIELEGHSEPLVRYHGAELAEISPASVIGLFFTLFLASLALLGILWGIAIAYYNSQKANKNVAPYIIVDILIGMISPILMVTSAVVFSVFLEYITKGSLNARVIIPKVLSAVELKKDKTDAKHLYWTILDWFYFEIKKPSGNERCLNYCSRTAATWILTAIVSLAFVLAVSFFLGTTIMDQNTFHSCPHSSMEVDCFNTIDFNYVDCNDPEKANMTFNLLHCFSFFRFGRDRYAIGAIAGSFAFYLAMLAVFTIAFYAAKVLNTFKPTIPWAGGLGCLLFSLLLFAAGGVNLYFTLEIIQTFQIFVLAIYILMIGVLVFMSKSWKQKDRQNTKTK